MLSNPEMMRTAIRMNPFAAQIMAQHPEMEFILSNPDMLRQMLTPENMRMAMGMMQNMRGMPGANPYGMFGGPPANPAEGTAPPPGPMGTLA
jgi:hypothetical protein